MKNVDTFVVFIGIWCNSHDTRTINNFDVNMNNQKIIINVKIEMGSG